MIGPQGEQLGILPVDQALRQAQEYGLDLVEVSPMAKPPVCKIMDYGKFKYETKKQQAEAKKKQTVVKLKEIKLRPKTEEHDYGFKVKALRTFIEEGNKARVTIMFRGREITHKEIGQQILMRIINDLKDVAILEQAARLEGRAMSMILAPNPKWLQAQKSRAQQQAAQAQKAAPPAAPPPAPQEAEAAPKSQP